MGLESSLASLPSKGGGAGEKKEKENEKKKQKEGQGDRQYGRTGIGVFERVYIYIYVCVCVRNWLGHLIDTCYDNLDRDGRKQGQTGLEGNDDLNDVYDGATGGFFVFTYLPLTCNYFIL